MAITRASQVKASIAPYFAAHGIAAQELSQVRSIVWAHGGEMAAQVSDAEMFVCPFGDGSYLVYTEREGFVEGSGEWTHPSGHRGLRYLPHWWGPWTAPACETEEAA